MMTDSTHRDHPGSCRLRFLPAGVSDAGRRFTIAILVEPYSTERVLATERLPMRHIREILRLKWILKPSHRETARSLGISPGAVASVMTRATLMD
jgi:DNA-directed RNA polymerase specialized sigma24 family protein